MNSSYDALLGRALLNVTAFNAPLWLIWYLGPRIGLVAVWQHVGSSVLLALVEILICLAASRRSLRRYQERWVEDERRRAGAARAPTLTDIRATRW